MTGTPRTELYFICIPNLVVAVYFFIQIICVLDLKFLSRFPFPFALLHFFANTPS